MTSDEKNILQMAADAALSMGTGVLTACQEELEDYGYTWGEEHEKFVFDYAVAGR
jgi:hypothetical protein